MTQTFIQINNCPACGSDSYRKVVQLSDNTLVQYLEFSRIKFDGLLDDWHQVIKPEIVRCKVCSHHWYIRQPSQSNLFRMYESGNKLSPTCTSVDINSRISVKSVVLSVWLVILPSFLDYGSGFGRWATAASEFSVYAYEPV